MVTIFLPLAASLFCISIELGNLAASQVKYLIEENNLVSLSLSLLLTFFHQCAQYPTKEHHKECHSHQIHCQHCIHACERVCVDNEYMCCMSKKIYFTFQHLVHHCSSIWTGDRLERIATSRKQPKSHMTITCLSHDSQVAAQWSQLVWSTV